MKLFDPVYRTKLVVLYFMSWFLLPYLVVFGGIVEGVNVAHLSKALADGGVLSCKIRTEILCSSNLPVAVAKIVLTNLLRPPEPIDIYPHLTLAAAARCAALVPTNDLQCLTNATDEQLMRLCFVLGRVSKRRAELQPIIHHLSKRDSPAVRMASRAALACLGSDPSAQDEKLRNALRGDGESRRLALKSLELCGSSDWISLETARHLVSLASEGGDTLATAAVVIGAMGRRASVVADLLEEAWVKDRRQAILQPLRDMILWAALARMRGQWDEVTGRVVVNDAGIGPGEGLPFVLDWLCYRMMTDQDLKPVFSLINCFDERTRIGAAQFCFVLGGRARHTESALLGALAGSFEESVREEFIRAIAMVGTRRTPAGLHQQSMLLGSEEERRTVAEWERMIVETGEALGPLFP